MLLKKKRFGTNGLTDVLLLWKQESGKGAVDLGWLNLILLIKTLLTCWKHGSFTAKLCLMDEVYLLRDAIEMPCVIINRQL